jgi:hypothetical protein
MKVDLPAPFGPVNPYRRPAENVVVTSSKSTFDPNRMETPVTEIIVVSSLAATAGGSRRRAGAGPAVCSRENPSRSNYLL